MWIRTIFYAEWRRGKTPTQEEEGIVREAWGGLAKGMRRLRDVLYEASQECKPGKKHGGDIDAIFELPECFEDWDIFEPAG